MGGKAALSCPGLACAGDGEEDEQDPRVGWRGHCRVGAWRGAGVIVPAAPDLAPGRDTPASAPSVPRVPPRAGTKHTQSSAEEGVLIAGGAPAAVSVSQQQHRLIWASPDPGSG